ncbi:hypothetical protein [Hypericibacter sp.]|uniref:hypothetical protein n=1 Tax=Hypericibacter sp. TaxID=2705401 RepID=UPI003D6CB93B
MGYDTGRKALQRENQLLEILQQATNDFKASVAKEPVASFIANDWLGSFSKLRKLNEELIADDDNDFATALKGEQALLTAFLKAAEDGGFSESWKELFQSDKKIAGMLLEP